MGCGRAQVTVRDGRTALGQVDVGQRRPIATCTGRAGGQAKQKIGNTQEEECSVRGVRSVDELIAEYLSSETKRVPALRRRKRVRYIEIVVHRFILIVRGVAKLERTQYLDVGQASLLRIVQTRNAYRLSRQRTRGRAS